MFIKRKSYRFGHILFWSVISAAFIGPGTLTTALKAGSSYQLELLWAIIFSTIACIVLQEASSRITITSGLTLGEAIQLKYGRKGFFNINQILTMAVIFGCVAYQAGNLTGATSGLKLIIDLPGYIILLTIYAMSAILMWIGKIKVITNILGVLVVLMALLFIVMAFQSNFSILHIIKSIFQPGIPEGSSLLVIGLIGTTIVPYNLFLGSGLSRNQDLKSTRFGLISAISIGGLITIFILITGTMIHGDFNFKSISNIVQTGIGKWGSYAFATGLFAAGFTSSVTAPLAAAITSKTLAKNDQSDSKKIYNITWIVVLTVGSLFSLLDYHPIIIIIVAQAINGLILPLVAISIFFLLHDKKIVPRQYRNNITQNILMIFIVVVTIFIGAYHLLNVISGLLELL